MFSNVIIYSVITAAITVIVCFIVSTLLPGIERKYIHARIQQRIGPLVISPGILAPIKFMFKENVKVESPVPGLYKALPIICFIVVTCLLIALTPQAFAIPALSSLVAIVGLLKVEEICYVLMGALSKSVMSVRMPFPDQIKGAAHNNSNRSFIEDISSRRSLRMITYVFGIVCTNNPIQKHLLSGYCCISASSRPISVYRIRSNRSYCIFHRLYDYIE